MSKTLDELAKAMKPSNANDAWWAGFRAYCEGVVVNPSLISGPNGEDIPEYWYWDMGWWFGSMNDINSMKGPFQ